MLAELKREVGQLVVQTAVAVTGKILTKEDQRRMAEETIEPIDDRGLACLEAYFIHENNQTNRT